MLPLHGIPDISPGDDLAALLVAGCAESGIRLQRWDVVVVTQKVVSKAEGALVDLAAIVDKKTTAEDVNAALKKAAEGPMKGILAYSEEELVSIDFKGNPHSSIIDAEYTKVMDGDFVKVLSWYDNEWGYSSRCVDLLRFMATKGL